MATKKFTDAFGADSERAAPPVRRLLGVLHAALLRISPNSLRGQFALALAVMGALVVAGGATAFCALNSASQSAIQLSQERLLFMQSAQDLLELTQLIQWQAQRMTSTVSEAEALNIYARIQGNLEQLERLTAGLAIGTDTSVLDLYQSSQLFRNSADILAYLCRPDAFGGQGGRVSLEIEEKFREAMRAAAQDMVLAGRAQSRVGERQYQDAVARVIAAAHASAYVVVAWLGLSLAAAWLIAQLFFGRLLLGRLQLVSRHLRLINDEPGPQPCVPVHGNDEIAEMARAVETCHSERIQLANVRSSLEEEQQYLRAIIENTADGIVVLRDREVVRINPASERIFGVRRHQVLGRDVATLLPDFQLRPEGLCGITCEAYARTSTDSAIPIELSVSPVSAVSAGLSVLVVRDTTQRKATEQHLLAARDASEAARVSQSKFFANISHELRTPLNAVLGYAQILLLQPKLTERQRVAASTIHSSGEHLLALIVDLLDLAKNGAGKLSLRPAKVCLADFVRVTSAIVRVKAEEAGLDFICDVAQNVPSTIDIDEKRLRQVLLNLLTNAIKFTDRGEVALRISVVNPLQEKSRLRFEVRDTGIGIHSDKLQAIFRPFEQLGDARQRAAGSGLGLAISQQLVQLMGAELSVVSAPGEGSTFAFELEISPAQETRATRAGRVAGYEGAPKRILVADDVSVNRLLISDMLRPLGFVVDEAGDGRQAVDQARAFPPDLIIMDLAMPVMSGIQAIRLLRQTASLSKVPILAVSADSADSLEAAALKNSGADVLIPKPFDHDRMLTEIGTRLSLKWVIAASEAIDTTN